MTHAKYLARVRNGKQLFLKYIRISSSSGSSDWRHLTACLAWGLSGWVQGNDRGRKLGFLSLQVPQPRGKTTSPFPHPAKVEAIGHS